MRLANPSRNWIVTGRVNAADFAALLRLMQSRGFLFSSVSDALFQIVKQLSLLTTPPPFSSTEAAVGWLVANRFGTTQLLRKSNGAIRQTLADENINELSPQEHSTNATTLPSPSKKIDPLNPSSFQEALDTAEQRYSIPLGEKILQEWEEGGLTNNALYERLDTLEDSFEKRSIESALIVNRTPSREWINPKP